MITLSSACLVQFIPLESLKEIYTNRFEVCNQTCAEFPASNEQFEIKKPTYMVIGDNPNGAYLKHVHLVLKRLGLKRVFDNETNPENADLLWSHSYPFIKNRAIVQKLKGYQKINHFPGCGFITNKVDLSHTDIEPIPKSFKLPSEEQKLREYAEKYPEKLFVQKNNQHRHIKIKKVSEIDFSKNDSFIQEFIANPLLVDGHKFDIGVYTIITSINPLRLYIYTGDVLFRYCPVKYHPFDPDNVDKYIVGDDYIPTWEMSSLSKYYNSLGLGMKGSFDTYLNSKGYDTQLLWQRVENAILQTVMSKESELANLVNV